MIRISTVETFHFCPNPLFFSLLGYPLIVFSNENISVLSLVVCFSLIGRCSFSDDYSFSYTFKIILQDYVNLEIIKERGSSINPDIHHSKVFSSGLVQSIGIRQYSVRLELLQTMRRVSLLLWLEHIPTMDLNWW